MVRHSPDQSNSPLVPQLQYYLVTEGFLRRANGIVVAQFTGLSLPLGKILPSRNSTRKPVATFPLSVRLHQRN